MLAQQPKHERDFFRLDGTKGIVRIDFWQMMKNLFYLITAGIISTLLIWFIGAIFLTSPTQYEYDAVVGEVVRKPGTVKLERGENWVCSQFGTHGLEIHDAEKLKSPNKKILIFGDSYIEANMVAWQERVQNQINLPKTDMIGIGFSGAGMDEYITRIRTYSTAIPRVSASVIFIGDISDIFPNNSSSRIFTKVSSRTDHFSYKFHLSAFRRIIRHWRLKRKLDFAGSWKKKSPIEKTTKPGSAQNMDLTSYWSEMLIKLKQAAKNQKILIVYAPTAPYISENRILMENRSQEIFIQKFQKICHRLDVPFISLKQLFIEEYKKNKEFTRGFFNTHPGRGHMNKRGHALAGQAIEKFFLYNGLSK